MQISHATCDVLAHNRIRCRTDDGVETTPACPFCEIKIIRSIKRV